MSPHPCRRGSRPRVAVVGEDGRELTVKQALLKIRDVASTKFSSGITNGLLIAYRRGILFEEDEQLFSRQL